jgi:hypothetical protein
MPPSQAPLPFKMSTVRNYQQLPDINVAAFGEYDRVNCQQVGFLAGLDIYVFGTITAGTSPSGNWDTNYFPWSILKRVQLSLNTGIPILDCSGYSLFLINSLMHRNQQPWNSPPASGGFNNSGTKGPRTGRVIAPSGAIAGANKFGFHLHVPVALDDALSGGLIQLQNQAYVATLNLTFAQPADLVAAGASLGTGPTISATVRTTQTHFSLPEDPRSYPNLQYVHQWLQQDVPWSATGDQLYQPPLGGVISRVIVDVQNNAAPQDFFSVASDPTSPNFGNLTVQFAGSQRPEVLDYRARLQQQYEQYGFDLPNGVLVHDFSLGSGSLELGWDGRDAYDTGVLTEFSLMTNITATPTNGVIRYVRELLLPRSA